MKISELYKALCDIYEIDSDLNIDHYLVSDCPSSNFVGNRTANREALLIRESGESMELGLFVHPDILEMLAASEDGLDIPDELSCVIEGASHFLYVIDRAEKEKRVSRLELELQGEVDKFLITNLIAASKHKNISREFFKRQFEDCSFDSSLGENEAECYKTASHFAAKYCSHLHERFFNPLRPSELFSTAKNFFNKDLTAKLQRLIP